MNSEERKKNDEEINDMAYKKNIGRSGLFYRQKDGGEFPNTYN